MLTETVDTPTTQPGQAVRIEAHPGPEEMARLERMLATAERPLLMLGGGGWTPKACQDIKHFAEANMLPVTVSFRRQDLFDNSHNLYAGDVGIGINPGLADRVKTADLIIVAGPRLGEMTTGGYTLFDIPVPRQPIVHIHPGAEELGRVYQPAMAINTGLPAFAAHAAKIKTNGSSPIDGGRADWAKQARADYLAWTEPPQVKGDMQMGDVMGWLRTYLGDDAVICNGAGNYTGWIHRFYRYRGFGTQLAPTSGSMGYGVPAAVAAKLRYPARQVVCFSGDGCFLMTGQELATSVQYGANVIFIVVNNGMYGTIRMHQEKEYPGRVSGTDLANPDFAALAKAYGLSGYTVDRTADFQPAFEAAETCGTPALIEIRIDPEVITPTTTLSALREAALARLGG